MIKTFRGNEENDIIKFEMFNNKCKTDVKMISVLTLSDSEIYIITFLVVL